MREVKSEQERPPVSALEVWSGLSFIFRAGLVALL